MSSSESEELVDALELLEEPDLLSGELDSLSCGLGPPFRGLGGPAILFDGILDHSGTGPVWL